MKCINTLLVIKILLIGCTRHDIVSTKPQEDARGSTARAQLTRDSARQALINLVMREPALLPFARYSNDSDKTTLVIAFGTSNTYFTGAVNVDLENGTFMARDPEVMSIPVGVDVDQYYWKGRFLWTNGDWRATKPEESTHQIRRTR
jgi:hypothetical protein